jgi:hypothetical protein
MVVDSRELPPRESPKMLSMRETTLLLPFALPPAEHAKDLIAALDAPALAMLLARGREAARMEYEPFAASLPHEVLLNGIRRDNSPPLAHRMMRELGLPPADGHWFVLQPAHFHVALDHLVLTDLRQLSLDEPTSRAFFDAAKPLIQELGFDTRYGDARRWFLRANNWETMRTCTPDAATGHNVDVWLPTGECAREWRKLHNEVQMLWHMLPLNDEREMHGERRVNALWLWGGASATDTPASPEPAVQLHDSLISHALASDWGRWLAAMQQIEGARIAPLLNDLQSGAIDRLTLQLTDATRIRTWSVTRASMRKFWVKPSLHRLR